MTLQEIKNYLDYVWPHLNDEQKSRELYVVEYDRILETKRMGVTYLAEIEGKTPHNSNVIWVKATKKKTNPIYWERAMNA